MNLPADPVDPPLRIPLSAWWIGLASIALALVVTLATPGPTVSGCFDSKHCFPVPRAPLLCGGLVLVVGSFLSVAVGRIPRHWVVGWSLTLSGLATVTFVGAPLTWWVLRWAVLTPAGQLEYVSLLGPVFTVLMVVSLLFGGLSVLLVASGLLASAWVGAPPVAPISSVAGPDPRPRWRRELEAIRAALLDGCEGTLDSSESLLVAELAYALQNKELTVPEHLEDTGAQLLELLTRDDRAFDTRAWVLRLLTQALALEDGRDSPYRVA